MLENMRQNYSNQCLKCGKQIEFDQKTQLLVSDGQTVDSIESIYKELFVKPNIKQNDELVVLLRKAFQEIET